MASIYKLQPQQQQQKNSP